MRWLKNNKMISVYRGRPITELSREELIEALEEVGSDLERERKGRLDDINFLHELHKSTNRLSRW